MNTTGPFPQKSVEDEVGVEPRSSQLERAGARLAAARRAARRQGVRIGALMAFGAKDAPVTIALSVVVSVASALVTVLGGGTVRHDVALSIVSFEHLKVWTALSAGLVAPGFAGYVVFLVGVFVVAAPVERRIGSKKFAVAALSTQICGALVGLGLAVVARMADVSWGFRLHVGTAVGPTTWIIGVVMVASSRMDTLWRRRIRVGLLALLITSALFGGHLQDVVRLAAALVGLVLGPAIVGRSARGPRLAGTQREGRVLVALVVAASVIGPVLAALNPNAVGPFAVLRDVVRDVQYTPAEVRQICADSPGTPDCHDGLLELRLGGVGPTILSLMPSMFMLFLADGLRRGRRFAFYATAVAQVALLVVSVANFVIRYIVAGDERSVFYGLESPTVYHTVVPFLLPLAVLILLLATRRYFVVSAPRGTYRGFGLFAAATTLIVGAVYVLGGLALGAGFDNRPSATALLADFPQRLVPPAYLQWIDPAFLPDSFPTTVLFEWTGILFWGALCGAVLTTFLSPATGSDQAATDRARSILMESTGSALSWMTTWKGNSYWFAPDGSGFVAYRVIAGVALTTGDPVGPRDALHDNVIGFAEFAVGNGWIPCFYSVTPRVRNVTDAIGWGGIQVGEETILDLADLAFTGKRFQDVRTAMNRAKKAGVHAEWVTFPDAPLAITDQISAISEEWVADKGMPEMGFTLGGLDEVDDPQVRCLVAVDEHRTVHGVTSWMPVYEDGEIVGWTLDFMRRRSAGFRPAMEFLIASAATLLQAEGARFVSLSGAPLAKIDARRQGAADAVQTAEDTPADSADEMTLSRLLDRFLDVVGRTLEPVYGFRSLLAFKAKFQPRYEPMHMTFADPAALPSIGNAIGRAYLPDVSIGQSLRLVRTMLER